MVEEDYVSFETAQLLKEKGFEGIAYVHYNKLGGTINTFNPITKNCTKCPTLQMAMKWLREVHHLVIQIELIDFLEHGEVWFYSIIERKTIKQLTGKDEDFTEHSYEEACDAAIKYSLENLIK